jgi:hypothetical protein
MLQREVQRVILVSSDLPWRVWQWLRVRCWVQAVMGLPYYFRPVRSSSYSLKHD